MSHANGKIYADSNYGVSIEDVRSVLGDTSTDLGTLCTSSLINKWSKVKPVRYKTGVSTPYFGELTPAIHASVNYGFSTDLDSSLVVTTPMDALDLLLSGEAYTYLPPNGATGSYAYRLTDFDGYNHNAPAPYSDYKNYPYNNRLPWFTLDKNPNAEILLSDLAGFSDFGDLSDWSLYLIYRIHGGTGSVSSLPATSDIEGCATTIGDLDSGLTAYWRHGASSVPNVQYDYCFAIYNNDDGEPYYIPLPILDTFTPTVYQPFTLILPSLSPKYETYTYEDNGITTIGGIRVPFSAEDVDEPFMIAIEIYRYHNGNYEKLNESEDEEYFTFTGTVDSYVYGGQWEDGTAMDFAPIGVPLANIDELYYRVRIYYTGDNRVSCFLTGGDIYTPGTFANYNSYVTSSQLIKLT